MSLMQQKPGGFLTSPAGRVSSALLFLISVLMAAPAWPGGTPDPGSSALVEDLGGTPGLPDNENQLLGILGANRGFGFGDYVSDAASGLQSTLGADAHYQFFIEIPPGQTNLTVEIFDAETGAGDLAGTEEHDQDNSTPWDTTTVYELLDPDGASVASISLPPQDCDPVTVGLQDACNNAWSDLGTFVVVNPDPGHWQLTVFAIDLGGVQDDNNSFGVRAHDGDSTAGGTEYHVYADTYVGIGQVHAPSPGPYPGFSRSHDFYPYITAFCSCDANDWDTDAAFDHDGMGGADLDEMTRFTPPRPPAGTPAFFDPVPSGLNGVWNQEVISGFSSNVDATNYGLWNLRWITGAFNFISFYMGDESATDPVLPPTPPGSGASPDLQPEAGAIRLYLPADGSRFFGERGGADDAVIVPDKPWVGHSWALLVGEPDLAVGLTSRIEVTITIGNLSAFPIQFDAVTTDPDVVDAVVPTNGGQTVYVAGSATITGGSSTAVSESGAGPWSLTFAPGVIAAGSTATLTYHIDITPSGLSPAGLDVTGAGAIDGTQGSYLDETCADAGGGASSCSVAAQGVATYDFGPLCELRAPVTGAIGVAKEVSSGPVDNLDGTFTVGFDLVVENFGTDPLTGVQVVDDLAATFPGPAVVTTVGAVAVDNSGGGMLVANGSYNGIGDTDLLDDTMSSMPVGTTSTISFTVTFEPNGVPGPFFNQAVASGTTPTGTVSDSSDDGADPDPDGDGNPGEDAGPGTCPSAIPGDNCENDPTPIAVPENPGISISKTAGAVTDAPTLGQFDVTFSLVVTNTGNVDLSTLQVVDDLSATFPAPAAVISASVLCTAGSCGQVTVDFTGAADTTLLNAAVSGLTVAGAVTLELSVRFDPNGEPGPFSNVAMTSALSPLLTTVQDTDSDSIAVPENPGIAVTKTAGMVSDAGGGLFDVTYTIVASNTGNVDLSSVQVTDDLSATFPGPASATAASTLCTAGSCGTVTVDHTGPADTTLLDAATSSLAVGAGITLELSVTFDPGGGAGPFTNTAIASGDSPLGAPVQDSDSADVTPPVGGVPVIGVAKDVVAGPIDNMDGTFTVSLLITVDNLGDVDLTDVQVTDDLALTFPAPSFVVLVTAPAAMITAGTGALAANAAYDGVGDIDLLVAAGSSLDVGASGEITFDVTFDPADLTSFSNTAIATADSSQGPTSDTSDDGTETDSDGDGDPDEAGENDPTPINLDVGLDIPTLGAWSLALLALLLGGLGSVMLRRRRVS